MARGPTLDFLRIGAPARVSRLHAPAGLPAWARQLEDLGFVPGESVQVLRRALFGGDRLVVRIGAGAIVALRRAEAACIHVRTGTP